MQLIKWLARKATQALVWVAVRMCQAIILVVDVAASVVEVVKETAKVVAEVTVEIVNRVRRSPIFQNIRKGLNIVKKFRDFSEDSSPHRQGLLGICNGQSLLFLGSIVRLVHVM